MQTTGDIRVLLFPPRPNKLIALYSGRLQLDKNMNPLLGIGPKGRCPDAARSLTTKKLFSILKHTLVDLAGGVVCASCSDSPYVAIGGEWST